MGGTPEVDEEHVASRDEVTDGTRVVVRIGRGGTDRHYAVRLVGDAARHQLGADPGGQLALGDPLATADALGGAVEGVTG